MDLSALEYGHAGSTPDHDSEGAALDLGSLSRQAYQQVLDRLLWKDFGAWADTLARVGNCVRPVRLRGTSERIDPATGEVLSSFSSADQPLGAVHVRCGNRRASECPSCSRLYAADMFHLIRAGVNGGKTVPESVADHPLVFATMTAPSFGRVHTSGRCHPGDPARRCPHGRQLARGVVHADGAKGRRSAALAHDELKANSAFAASQLSDVSAEFGVVVSKMPLNFLDSRLEAKVTQGSKVGAYKLTFKSGAACLTFANRKAGETPKVRLAEPKQHLSC